MNRCPAYAIFLTDTFGPIFLSKKKKSLFELNIFLLKKIIHILIGVLIKEKKNSIADRS
jgi:hypothetical protein